jgi:ketosteroid isomerase-like protein
MELAELIEEQKKALQAWYDGFGSGDIEYAYTYFEDDCTWLGIGEDFSRVLYKGKKEIIAYQSTWVKKVWTGSMKYFPINTLCDGHVLMAEWEDEAISSQTGEVYRNRGIFVWEYDGGPLVKRGKAWFDSGPLAGKHIDKFTEVGLLHES